MRKLAPFLAAVLAASLAPGAAAKPYRFDGAAPLAVALAHPQWAAMARQHESEQAHIDACFADAATCPPYLRGYRRLILRAEGLKPHAQLTLINRFFNKRRYKMDSMDPLTGMGQWHTLSRLLQTGGDCEDFAIAKYFALRHLGFDRDTLRVVIAYDKKARDFHALLAVNLGGRSHLLENDNRIVRGGRQREYDVSYAINEDYWWDHAISDVAKRRTKSF